VYDVNGARYLDFIAGIGVNALGHAHPRIVKVIREQAALLIHSSNLYYHEYQGPLAKKLAETSGLQRTFFTNSGTEAMEGALKMIRSHGNHSGTGKHEIISLENSFHGRTLGALSITGQPNTARISSRCCRRPIRARQRCGRAWKRPSANPPPAWCWS
jgi:acetylornithine/N-succinyldiaminopimelate aminotransferase